MDDDFTYVSSWQGFVSFRGLRGPTGATVPFIFHHRRLRPQDRRLACLDLNDDRFRLGRPEPGYLPEGAV